jgi:hypothetical protein
MNSYLTLTERSCGFYGYPQTERYLELCSVGVQGLQVYCYGMRMYRGPALGCVLKTV